MWGWGGGDGPRLVELQTGRPTRLGASNCFTSDPVERFLTARVELADFGVGPDAAQTVEDDIDVFVAEVAKECRIDLFAEAVEGADFHPLADASVECWAANPPCTREAAGPLGC